MKSSHNPSAFWISFPEQSSLCKPLHSLTNTTAEKIIGLTDYLSPSADAYQPIFHIEWNWPRGRPRRTWLNATVWEDRQRYNDNMVQQHCFIWFSLNTYHIRLCLVEWCLVVGLGLHLVCCWFVVMHTYLHYFLSSLYNTHQNKRVTRYTITIGLCNLCNLLAF